MAIKDRLALRIDEESKRQRRAIGWSMDIDKDAKTMTIANENGFNETLPLSDEDMARPTSELIDEYHDTIQEERRLRRERKLAREITR